MKNLNKFSKAEIINKFKELEKNKTNSFANIFGYFLILKNFLLKITFLTLIIKIFKQFKIIRRLWLIINTIVMSIFGISMIDFYGLSIFSAFFTEISQITGNIINYLSNTKFYAMISSYLGYKINTPTRIEPFTRIQPTISRDEIEIRRNSKISSWFEKEEIVETENNPIYKNKYFIYGVIFVASCLTYYYFGEDLKIYTISLWEWMKGERPRDLPPANPMNPPRVNPEVAPSSESSRMNPLATLFGLNKNKKGTISVDILDEDSALEVENSSDNPIPEYFVEPKGKEIVNPNNLTSPSLDDLNNKAEKTWSETRPISPISSSSSSSSESTSSGSTDTIKPTNLPPSNKSGSIPKTTVEDLEETTNKINEILNKFGNIKPFIINPKLIKNLSNNNWKNFINNDIKGRINLIENIFNSENELTKEEGLKMADNLIIIIKSYEATINVFETNRPNMSENQIKIIKDMSFFIRSWISDYSSKIFTAGEITVNPGTNLDSPKSIIKDILED